MSCLTLPESLRPIMRKQFGTLYEGPGEVAVNSILKDLGNPTKLISVGDVTTFHLLKSGIVPDILIVDDRTHRGPASEKVIKGTKHDGFKELEVNNPSGTITEDLLDALADAVSSDQRFRIFVKGEEDLAALPAVIMAPDGSVVLYGQPDKGMMLVRITSSKKLEMKELMDQIINEQEDNQQLDSIRRKLYGY
ncbi:uncharacterized protein (UPF0218 family) [Methanohalophilus levihalophilus]|nr:GTP-dependent dephospho-CoA kinase family protein [Methanohalophilus levihalophilus]MBP2030440.1 uncharacterized protein (UPF0218 family) [Methanohalophilus levihalophilus]